MKRLFLLIFVALVCCTSDAALTICRRYRPDIPRNYVTNGLTHYWDAEFNKNRSEHDANAKIWKDLVGTNHLTMLSHELLTFTAHSAKFGYTSYWSPKRTGGMFVGTSIPFDEIKTVEICALFAKGIGDTTVGENNVMFSNGATAQMWRSSQLGDKYCRAPYYYSLSLPQSVTHLGTIARTSESGYVGFAAWNPASGGESRGAEFQDYIERGFTISGWLYNYEDTDGYLTQRFWKPETRVSYWGYSGQAVYNNTAPYTYGLSNPYATPTEPVGVGLSVGGVTLNGGQYSLFYGYIYAIRVYNRKLTAEESAANATIDYQAFYNKKE